ncbi:MAG: nucleotide exchange factor GrpE [Lachnospiraceae bacterium]|nr:nucleotide exchange factor GrpE [Lachnospiraceae bacterium]
MEDVTKEEIIKEAIEKAKKEDPKKAKKEKQAEKAEDKKEETAKAEDLKEKETPAEEQPEEEARESQEEGAEEKKGGFFKKKDKTDKNKERIEELEDKVKRQLAEFENFRNRTEKEKTQMYDMGAKSVLEKILPVIDNFERGLATVPEDQAQGAFAEGMNMIYKQLLSELEKMGVTPIEAVGKEFDPNLHNAVMQVESEEYESGFVAQEMQKGYMYRDTVLRHSMVGVVS